MLSSITPANTLPPRAILTPGESRVGFLGRMPAGGRFPGPSDWAPATRLERRTTCSHGCRLDPRDRLVPDTPAGPNASRARSPLHPESSPPRPLGRLAVGGARHTERHIPDSSSTPSSSTAPTGSCVSPSTLGGPSSVCLGQGRHTGRRGTCPRRWSPPENPRDEIATLIAVASRDLG